MNNSSYGLPGERFLDSPFGLAPKPAPFTRYPPPAPLPDPVRSWAGPVPVPLPRPAPPPPPIWATPTPPPMQVPYAPGKQPGRMVESGQGTGLAPLVGKDIPIQKLIGIQRAAESTNNYQAINREKKGNTASGAYQYTDGTWNNYGGYPKAMLAPKEVQDRRFAEDISRRVKKHNGDMFKALAEHYLPIQAGSPEKWSKPATFKIKGKTVTVGSVENYLRHVLKDSPYINQLDAYLEQRR